MRAFFVALLILGASLGAGAAEVRKYAILSLVGDRLLIVRHVPTVGSNLDRNLRQFLPLEDPSIEKAALLAMDDALRHVDATATPVLLFSRDAALYSAQMKLLDEGASSLGLLDAIRELLRGTETTHLVLLTKARDEARLRLRNQSVGSGSLEGMGFYIDLTLPVVRGDTREVGTGFLAPFAYFQIALIDLGSGKIVKEERIRASIARSAARSEKGDAWNALSSTEKVRVLQELIRSAIAKAIPALLSPPS